MDGLYYETFPEKQKKLTPKRSPRGFVVNFPAAAGQIRVQCRVRRWHTALKTGNPKGKK